MTLLSLQRDVGAWLRNGSERDAARFPPAARGGLGIYQNNYRAQLADCLESSFPVTHDWIGGAAFHDAVVAHVAHMPPSSWTLDAYSRDFPDTLGRLYPDDPEIAELATLERALGDAFVGADADPLPAALVASVDWDRAILRFTPTLDLCDATTNAAAIWTALDAQAMPPAVEMLPAPATLLVWRYDAVSRFRTIDTGERDALLLAHAGTPFAALCAEAVTAHGEADGIALAGAWLGDWLSDGLVTDIISRDERCA